MKEQAGTGLMGWGGESTILSEQSQPTWRVIQVYRKNGYIKAAAEMILDGLSLPFIVKFLLVSESD
jgi:hypothetical protein